MFGARAVDQADKWRMPFHLLNLTLNTNRRFGAAELRLVSVCRPLLFVNRLYPIAIFFDSRFERG